MAAGRNGVYASRNARCPVVVDAGRGARERPASRSERRALVALVVGRVGVDGGIRAVYPFLPVIADALQVSFATLALVVAARKPDWVGRTAPRAGGDAAADPGCCCSPGSRSTGGSALVVLAVPAVPAGVRVAVLLVGFAGTGFARPLFALPLQAWVAAHVPVARRGRAVGVTELGPGAVPGRHGPGRRVARPALGLVGPVLAGRRSSPASGPRRWCWASRGMRPGFPSPWRPAGTAGSTAARRRTSWIPGGAAVCAMAVLAVAAGELLLVVYAPWLETFGLSVPGIALSALLIVAAELAGELAAAAVADRIGLCRTVFLALAVSAAVYAVLGGVGHVGPAALAIVVWFVAFEVTVVVLVALASALRPGDGSAPGCWAR